MVNVSTDLVKNISEFIVDSELHYPIYYNVRKNGKDKLQYSDHYPIVLTLKNMKLKTQKDKGYTRSVEWNLKKPDG